MIVTPVMDSLVEVEVYCKGNKKYALAQQSEILMGKLACRHDVNIQQGGEHTSTTMRHFLLCGADQIHDLHTSLVLDHPEGVADQLHKCIVSDSTGHGIFDGNVKVALPPPPSPLLITTANCCMHSLPPLIVRAPHAVSASVRYAHGLCAVAALF
jgi:hypothetical protein